MSKQVIKRHTLEYSGGRITAKWTLDFQIPTRRKWLLEVAIDSLKVPYTLLVEILNQATQHKMDNGSCGNAYRIHQIGKSRIQCIFCWVKEAADLAWNGQ